MKVHKLQADKEFQVRDAQNNLIEIPANYKFSGKAKTYVKNLCEKMRIKVEPDGNKFKSTIIMTDVPCSYVSFID
jgi:hypothetical protein